MTKRAFNFDDKTNNKKPKINDDIEALWGDELDESVFDDCIKLASQALGTVQGKENESILPAYDDFKTAKPIFSSTQMDANKMPTTSNYYLNSDIQRLRLQCEEKDGEIAILRSQIRDVKLQSNVEYQKSHTEWKTKLGLTEKQVQSIKSELEFKNLEIANLKQKLSSLTKIGMNITINNDVTRSLKPSTSKKQNEVKNIAVKKLFGTTYIDYPLKNVFNDSFLTIPKTDKCIIDNKLTHTFKNAIPYLQNKNVSTRFIIGKNRADLNSIYPTMLKLSEYNSEQLNSTNNTADINKIVCACLQALEDLLELLQEIKLNLRTEDLLEMDSSYLKDIETSSDSARSSDNELGRKPAFIINFLSVLLPYSAYLRDYFIHNKHLNIRGQEDFTKYIYHISKKGLHNGHDFINKLITIVNIIGEIRKSHVLCSFLNSTIKLFTRICQLNGYTNLSESISAFTKELIFCRPPLNVTFELTYLFKEASNYTTFLQFLLNKSKNCCSIKKGILYFNEDACRFYIFALIFNRSLSINKTVPFDICLNMLIFMLNTYKSSYFIHHQDIKGCECLPQLYKSQIELIFRMLEEVSQRKKPSIYVAFFKKIVLKLLNLMAFHCYELTEKYITVYSQFKEIERRLSENGVCDLDRLNVNEDIPEIESKSFENIGF